MGHPVWEDMDKLPALRLLTWITYLRMAVVPVVMALILVGQEPGPLATLAAAVFALGATTDFVDGFLARRWDITTTVGSFLDTTADKLLVSGALIALVAVGRASPWVALVIIGRELVILGLRAVAADAGTVIKPSLFGKSKAVVQFAAILLAIVRFDVALGPLLLDEWAMLAAAVVTVLSGAEYLMRFSSVLGTAGSGRGGG